ncbi:MAG TPA: serine dehydratase subunit alpha family protein [Candidatus Avidesulfovibrio excrementigallinarum]|nr:serine dehydratase subunit alpha family protein [Candidatus Avidesulfovibrio excrementigallinarum]
MCRDPLIALLKRMVKPALGCTEPAAIAIAVARAKQEAPGQCRNVRVRMSGNIFKNARGVGIPGTSEYGIHFAVALALVCGDWEKGLEVFSSVDDKAVKAAHELMKNVPIEVEVSSNEGNFFIEATIEADAVGKAVIRHAHTNIVRVERNGEVCFSKEDTVTPASQSKTEQVPLLSDMTMQDLRREVEAFPLEDIAFLIAGVPMNYRMAEIGLAQKPGLALGAALQGLMEDGLIERNMVNTVRMYAAAAADARMAGLKLPVMSSAGSGNHGITAILPPYIVCRQRNLDEEKLIRALAFSHLVTIAIKEFSGPLSPVCGCAIAAGIGAAVSIGWLLDCDDTQIAGIINSMSGTLAGMLCDGAKGGCAFKLATAAGEAVLCALLAQRNVFIRKNQGIVGVCPETTIQNVGRICTQGMGAVDSTVIGVMLAEEAASKAGNLASAGARA